MIYDNRNLLAFTQDGNQRAKTPTAEWTAYFYDNLYRPTKTALYGSNKTRAELTTLQNGLSYTWGTFGWGTPSPFPADFANTAVMVPIKFNYYDNYSYPAVKPFTTNTDNALAGSIGAEPLEKTDRTQGMPTGSKVRILNSTTFLINTIYYDERGRPIQTHVDNIKQGTDVTTLQYDYSSKLLNKAEKHTATGTSFIAYSTVTKYSFDILGRVTDIYKKFGSNPFKHISNYAFDNFGRLKKKRLAPGYTATGKTEIETLNYTYNLHGQLTGINKNYALKLAGLGKWDYFFGQYLGYENADNIFSNKQLDGHITGNLWSTQGDNEQRKYDYTYDNAGRLTKAKFNQKEGTDWTNTQLDFTVTGSSGKITYDLNGNLQNLLQMGVVVGNATPITIDDLKYTYQALSNKLTAVTDLGNAGAANGKLGDFTDVPNGGSSPILSINDDYEYDHNGNLIVDLNKNVKNVSANNNAGITYNFLDKPEQIRMVGKGTITIVYDADGNKLQKTFTPENATINAPPPVTTTYINGFVYKENALQFISFEEGRLRVIQEVNTNNNYDYIQINGSETLPQQAQGGKGAWDYFIRDYQSNVRMVLTEQTHKGSNICTMETNRAANEEPLFGKTDATGNPVAGNEVQDRFATSNIPGQSIGNGWTNPTIGNHVAKLFKGRRSSAGKDMGPNSLLKVMAGDKVSATTIYYYQNPVTNTSSNTSALNSILSSLTSAIGNSMGAGAVVHGAASNITSNLSSNIPFNNITSPDAGNDAGTNPKAYLTVIFFDERFNFVAEGSTTQRVQAAGNGQAPLVIDNIKAPKNGYAYIYISNESVEPVYFDNLRVVHERAQIIEENHYYAYGLKIAGLSSVKAGDINEGELKNKRQYQGAFAEYDDDIQWNEFALRDYDPQIARWVQQDPYQQFASPYVALGSDPVNMVDPSGGWSTIANGLQKGLSMTRLGVCALTTLAGAILGNAAYGASGGQGAKGLIIGAFAGLASNFSGSIGMAVFQGVVGVGNEVIKNQLAQMPVATPMPVGVSSTGVTNVSQVNAVDNAESISGARLTNYSSPDDVFDYYESPDAAALAWARQYYNATMKNGVEFSSLIFSVKGVDKKIYYSYTRGKTFKGVDGRDPTISSPGPDDKIHFLPATKIEVVGLIHSHLPVTDVYGGQNENFSDGPGQDIPTWSAGEIDWYLVTPKGYLKVARKSNGAIFPLAEGGNKGLFDINNFKTYWDVINPKLQPIIPKFINPFLKFRLIKIKI